MIPVSIKRKGRELLEDGAITVFEEETPYPQMTRSVVVDDRVSYEVKHVASGNYQCDCIYFQENSICAHIYAVELEHEARQNKIEKANFKERILAQEANTLLSLFQENMDRQFDTFDTAAKTRLKVEYILRMQDNRDKNMLTLDLKVGQDRTYVVKNIGDFLQAIRENTSYFFTKNFSYDPNDYYFGEQDLAIFNELTKINEIAKMYDTDSFYWNKSYAEEKVLIIPPSLAETILADLMTQNTVCIHEDIKYSGLVFKKGALPFSFVFRKNEDGDMYQLVMEELQQASYLESYQLLFLNGVFYRPSDAVWEQLRPLIHFHNVTENEVVQFTESQLSEVMSYVLPSLQKSGHVQIDPSIEDRVIQQPLLSKMWISQKKGEHILKLEHHYGSQVFDPFALTDSVDPDGRIMIRDMETEAKIMHRIEAAPVHFSETQMVVNSDEASLYEFYYRVVPSLATDVAIYLEEGLEEMVEEHVKPTTTIDVSNDNDYLSVAFDFQGIDESEIQEVLQSLREKRKYHRLNNGRFLSLEDESYKQMEAIFDILDVRKKEVSTQMAVPLYRGMQIYEAMGSAQNEHNKFSRTFRDLLHEIVNQENVTYSLPEGLNAELREYQVTGFEWMKSLGKYHLGGVLADDMGLGKTLQAITYITSCLEENSDMKPVLIVTPASLLYNWSSEFEKFAPNIPVTVIHGTSQMRLEIIQNIAPNNVYLISYPSLRQDEQEFLGTRFQTVILDEAQAIKNYNTKASQAVRALKTTNVFALSGTPLENSIDELWTMFQTIMPGFFPSLRKFKELPHERVAQMIRPFLMRRLKRDVVKELPDKIETNLYSELTEPQKAVYLAYLEKIQKELASNDGNPQEDRIKLLAGLTRLRQICCDPALFVENYEGGSGKLVQLFDTIQTARESGKRILIFSQFTSMLQIMKAEAEKAGHSYFYMDGSTPAKSRMDLVNAFNAGDTDLFFISLKAGGTGLNLTGADTVILYDLWWNPAVEEQAASRAHRIGQKNVVQVIRMITKGTIEEKIYNLQKQKQALMDALIQPGEQMLHRLTTDEIKEILTLN
ncbi:DEAD/DEAH box helicase family protein [Listeria weihenstephanensis]|uniref:DEAD/DEAH box helicase family protein n=1 Tax=Listeria weihenstephanensis TaxID=1006155 RepID=A0A841Z435_9LIST|nr:DEAD/DEAH box helicase [Listeria weihenstephanensis]MBC1499968.1 DEAD/DEAH box helicase family protein [Listeria weihenstephanensis]